MQTAWILIVINWIGGSSSGPITTMQEFSTEQSCKNAHTELIRQYRDWDISERKVRAFCVPK